MNEQPLVSIIVPVYKVEQYLGRCVNSILTQSFQNYELILVDDGSPDNCPLLCDQFAMRDNRVQVIHKENGGVSSARNAGITVAKGEYIWFIDSDDYIQAGALEKLASVISGNPCLIVFNSKINKELAAVQFNAFFDQYYAKYVPGFGPCNKLFKRAVLIANEILFDVEERIGEDLLFNLFYYKACFDGNDEKMIFLDDQLYVYEIRENSAMTTPSKHRLEDQLRLFRKASVALRGILSPENLTYLFLLHFLAGILQSKQGGLTVNEFATIDYSPYTEYFTTVKKVLPVFFTNENASILGRIRLWLIILEMGNAQYHLAGKLAGLKSNT